MKPTWMTENIELGADAFNPSKHTNNGNHVVTMYSTMCKRDAESESTFKSLLGVVQLLKFKP